jgi:magnesium transporter
MIDIHKSQDRPVWIDLLDPTSEELKQARDQYGLNIPLRSQLEEIELSSRLRYENGAFIISVPITPHQKEDDPHTTPLGFVLTKDILVTVRFSQISVLQTVMQYLPQRPRTPLDVFVMIFEAMADYGADQLEELRDLTLKISQRIFRRERRHGTTRHRQDLRLKEILLEIGGMDTHLSRTRDTLLVLQRAVPFISEHNEGWLDDALKARLKTIGADVKSLNDYEVHLTDKIQFLLDATLGFINNEQTRLFKVLTIWSVAGIPPTLVASIWGMNFQSMPELSLPWGYPAALAIIATSAGIPLILFKIKGWW